jgi:hypothetical protein
LAQNGGGKSIAGAGVQELQNGLCTGGKIVAAEYR